MTTIFYSISHSSMAIIILLYLFQITVLSLKKNILHACSSRTCRPLLHPRSLSTLRIPGYPTLVPGICTSTNISASKIPPQQDSDLVNTLGGKRAPFPNHLGSFAELFPLRHDARLDFPPQQYNVANFENWSLRYWINCLGSLIKEW